MNPKYIRSTPLLLLLLFPLSLVAVESEATDSRSRQPSTDRRATEREPQPQLNAGVLVAPRRDEELEVAFGTSEFNVLRAMDSVAAPGATQHPVTFSTVLVDDIQGFSLVVGFDSSLLTCTSLSIVDTITEAVGAEYTQPNIDNNAGVFVFAVLLDLLPPFEAQVIPATGLELPIAVAFFDVSATAGNVPETTISFPSGVGNPPVSNTFVVDNQSIPPTLVEGVVEFLQMVTFVRSDATMDGEVTIADALTVIEYLNGLLQPLCLLSLDVNDDNEINLIDPLYVLSYLYLGGPEIPAPYPNPGMDPTPDELSLPCLQ